jgi:hypothetical protein
MTERCNPEDGDLSPPDIFTKTALKAGQLYADRLSLFLTRALRIEDHPWLIFHRAGLAPNARPQLTLDAYAIFCASYAARA